MVRLSFRAFFYWRWFYINRFEEARNVNIYQLLERLNIKCANNLCRCVNPAHEDRHPSMHIKNNRFKCFSCGVGGSTIDLVRYALGVNEVEAVNYILDKSIIPIKEKVEAKETKTEAKQDIREIILKNSRTNTEILEKYFLFRGLQDIYKKVNKEQIEILSNYYKGKSSIIYNFPKHGFTIQKTIGRKGVFVHGHNKIIAYRGYKHNKFAIVEGIEDGLSALMLGYNFICLNSISNLDKLFKVMLKYKDKLKNNVYYIALDNDLAGIKSNKQLKAFLIENGYKYSYKVFALYYNCRVKDLNEYIKIINKGGTLT